MIQLTNFLSSLNTFMSLGPVILTVFSLSFFLKIGLLISIIIFKKKKQLPNYTLVNYLLLLLIGASVIDSQWILTNLRSVFFQDTFDSRFYIFWTRISWGFCIVQYQSQALFIEKLLDEKQFLTFRQKVFAGISAFIFSFFILMAFFNFNCYNNLQKPWIEYFIQRVEFFYALYILIPCSLLVVFLKLRQKILPRILSKQLKLLVALVITPYWISDIIQTLSLFFSAGGTWLNLNYTFVTFNTILLNYAIYHCARRVMGLRFLNLNNHVQANTEYSFTRDFKNTIELFSHVTRVEEIQHILQPFFKEAFGIPVRSANLYIRSTEESQSHLDHHKLTPTEAVIERFFATHGEPSCTFLRKEKIIIYDELAFSNFYQESDCNHEYLALLDAIDADILLPIYHHKKMLGYLVVDRHARKQEFYTEAERDEFLVLASYLSNVINLIRNRTLENLMEKQKELEEELYLRHQENNQYRESIRSFMHANKSNTPGIMFYKHGKFMFANQMARELVPFDPALQPGHPLSKALKKLCKEVEEFKTTQSTYAKDEDGNKLLLNGIPHLNGQQVVITINYPQISDIMKHQLDLIKEPSDWDYLLYLETTESGQLIEQLVPGVGPKIVSFKIDLLKAALGKKATLLDIEDEDLDATVDLLHHVSLREELHKLELQGPTKIDTAMTLFGISPLFAQKNGEYKEPLLKKLDKTGTLFIKNVHFLDLEAQEYLAEFIRYGFFRKFRSDQKVTSNVRIICSTSQQLSLLVQEGKFSKELFEQLQQTTLSMPSLVTLPEHELLTIAQAYSDQLNPHKEFKNLLALTDADKKRLMSMRPVSLLELKNKVKQIIQRKSKQTTVVHKTDFESPYGVTNPTLKHVANMGRQALKDRRIMAELWKQFGCQSKIAQFLGVNRSSVHRRCKMYGLEK